MLYMRINMAEPQYTQEQISLFAQLEALEAALEMHMKRSEAIALQVKRLIVELEDNSTGAKA